MTRINVYILLKKKKEEHSYFYKNLTFAVSWIMILVLRNLFGIIPIL